MISKPITNNNPKKKKKIAVNRIIWKNLIDVRLSRNNLPEVILKIALFKILGNFKENFCGYKTSICFL